MPDAPDATSDPDAVGRVEERVRRWLEPRLREVPPDLADAVRAAVGRALADDGEGAGAPGTDADARPALGPVADLLARAALRELDEVTDAEGRGAALALLAADAVLTYAFEAALDDGTEPAELAAAAGLRGAIGRRMSAPERSTGA